MGVREFPCCMCPALSTDFKQNVCENCDFVVVWSDERGWSYFVRGGLGEPTPYKAFYKKEWKKNAHGCRALEYRDSFWAAQADLNRYASRKGWTVIKRGLRVKEVCV